MNHVFILAITELIKSIGAVSKSLIDLGKNDQWYKLYEAPISQTQTLYEWSIPNDYNNLAKKETHKNTKRFVQNKSDKKAKTEI